MYMHFTQATLHPTTVCQVRYLVSASNAVPGTCKAMCTTRRTVCMRFQQGGMRDGQASRMHHNAWRSGCHIQVHLHRPINTKGLRQVSLQRERVCGRRYIAW